MRSAPFGKVCLRVEPRTQLDRRISSRSGRRYIGAGAVFSAGRRNSSQLRARSKRSIPDRHDAAIGDDNSATHRCAKRRTRDRRRSIPVIPTRVRGLLTDLVLRAPADASRLLPLRRCMGQPVALARWVQPTAAHWRQAGKAMGHHGQGQSVRTEASDRGVHDCDFRYLVGLHRKLIAEKEGCKSPTADPARPVYL